MNVSTLHFLFSAALSGARAFPSLFPRQQRKHQTDKKQKTMKTITRLTVLFALTALAALALMAIPEEGLPIAKWFALLLASKAVFAIALVGIWKLYTRWSARGGFGEFFDRLLNAEEG